MSVVGVHYQLTGPPRAPVLLLSNPLGSTLEIWDPVVAEVAEHFRVLRYDHRGHGRSPVPPGPYTIADLAGDALALLDRLEIERVHCCGLSLGGMVAIWLGARAGERLSSLTLCCTTARFEDLEPYRERAAAARSAGTAVLADETVRRWYTPDYLARNPELVDRTRQMIAATSDEGYAACVDAIVEWDGRGLLASIRVPTLVIAGSQDPGTPPVPHGEALAAGIPGATLEIVDSAHLAPIEQAEPVAALLVEHAAGAAAR